MSIRSGRRALTLFDHDTTVWLDPPLAEAAVERWLKFHSGAPIAREPGYCSFAMIAEPRDLPAFDVSRSVAEIIRIARRPSSCR